MKKILALLLALAMVMSLAACGASEAPAATEAPKAESPASPAPEAPAAEPVTIKVAAIETAYGSQVWVDVAAAFEAETGIKVNLITDKKLEDVIGASMQGGEYPDVIHLATGREAGLTEQFIKDKNIADITDVLSLRQQLAKSSVKKYTAMENAVCKDNRARGMFQFYGANRTGRFAGRLVQLQNLPQNHMSDLAEARGLVRCGNYDALDMLYDDIPDTLFFLF